MSGIIPPPSHVVIAWCLISYEQGNLHLSPHYKEHLPATRMYDGSTQQVFVPQPTGYLDKASYETWDVAPEYGHVAPHDEHIVNLKLVHLRHICKVTWNMFSARNLKFSSYLTENWLKVKLNSVVWVRERTIPIERPPLVGEVSANFYG
jgi:hypothetical protein